MCGWEVSVDDVLQRHGTPSQTGPASTPEAIQDQQSSGGPSEKYQCTGLPDGAGTRTLVDGRTIPEHADTQPACMAREREGAGKCPNGVSGRTTTLVDGHAERATTSWSCFMVDPACRIILKD